MKIHVIRADQQAIENYKRVTVSNNLVDLSEISDNECELILANDAMDSFSVSKGGQLITSLLSKLRMGGEIVLGGTSLRVFCKYVLNGQLDEAQASELVGAYSSLTNVEPLVQAFNGLGVEVLETSISGLHYEVRGKRRK